jgi:hypothetical protein
MSNSSKYGYTTLNYKNCCNYPTIHIKPLKVTRGVSEGQYLLNITSCCKSFVKSKKKGTNQHNSYERVLRRRRGQAFEK